MRSTTLCAASIAVAATAFSGCTRPTVTNGGGQAMKPQVTISGKDYLSYDCQVGSTSRKVGACDVIPVVAVELKGGGCAAIVPFGAVYVNPPATLGVDRPITWKILDPQNVGTFRFIGKGAEMTAPDPVKDPSGYGAAMQIWDTTNAAGGSWTLKANAPANDPDSATLKITFAVHVTDDGSRECSFVDPVIGNSKN